MEAKSNYIKYQKQEASKGSSLPEQIRAALECASRLSEDELPPLEMMNTIGSHDRGHFVGTMNFIFTELVTRAKLTLASNVLDIGCGCGRIALPFSYFLTAGQYFGVDVWALGTDWCTQKISPRMPNFIFRALPSQNNYYFDAYNNSKTNVYSLSEIPDKSLDLAFAISVFTHLDAADAHQYFAEISRTLKSTGIAYISAFIIDHHFFRYVARTKEHSAVKEIANGVYQAYSGQDFFSGFTYDKWRRMVEECGLQIVSYEVGSWAQKPGARLYQDTFVLIRPE